MRYMRCKCGIYNAWTSIGPPACVGCEECGTTLNGKVVTRVVRKVTRCFITHHTKTPHWRTLYCFIKQRRSRYSSPHTVVNPRELLHRRYVATGKRIRLNSTLDRKISQAIAKGGYAGAQIINQSQVVGVVS